MFGASALVSPADVNFRDIPVSARVRWVLALFAPSSLYTRALRHFTCTLFTNMLALCTRTCERYLLTVRLATGRDVKPGGAVAGLRADVHVPGGGGAGATHGRTRRASDQRGAALRARRAVQVRGHRRHRQATRRR